MMETWEQTDGSFVPWSTLHLDKHGQVIMAYFGHRIMRRHCSEFPRTFNSKEEFDTWLDKNELRSLLVSDGLRPSVLHRLHEGTYKLVSAAGKYHLKSNPTDNGQLSRRYNKDFYSEDLRNMVYASQVPPWVMNVDYTWDEDEGPKDTWIPDYTNDITGEPQKYNSPVGALHLYTNWKREGEENGKPSILSKTAWDSINEYADVEDEIQRSLYSKAFASFPSTALDYRRAFRASSTENIHPCSIFTGHVIDHNTAIHQQRDIKGGLCAATCTGEFEGGHLYLPYFQIAHMYNSGSISLFCSRSLYQGISNWKPKEGVSPEGIPPGRTAHTFQFHHDIFEQVRTKPDGWARQTGNGLRPWGGLDSTPTDKPYPQGFDLGLLVPRAVSMPGHVMASKSGAPVVSQDDLPPPTWKTLDSLSYEEGQDEDDSE
ncbi:hypothetical protein FRC14_004541 [Serendipita sp. 396]|nr:hypothetical protein FRC14_004541 [Serendipita sp. 396]